jgi:hypothetical protein
LSLDVMSVTVGAAASFLVAEEVRTMWQPNREVVPEPGRACFRPPDEAWRKEQETVPAPRLCFRPDDVDDVLGDLTDDERALLSRVG